MDDYITVIILTRPGMHNIWPAVQMLPEEAFYLACKAHNFIHTACLLKKTSTEWVKPYQFLPSDNRQKFLCEAIRFELCILVLCQYNININGLCLKRSQYLISCPRIVASFFCLTSLVCRNRYHFINLHLLLRFPLRIQS